MAVYLISPEKCLYEGMTKEDIYNLIASATGSVPTGLDDAFITKIKEQNKQTALKFWRGTQAEYNALTTKDTDTYYIITDVSVADFMSTNVYDTDNSGVVDNSEKLGGVAPSGYMTLDGAQTAIGEKTFLNTVNVNGVVGSNTTRQAKVLLNDTERMISLYILPGPFSTFAGIYDELKGDFIFGKKFAKDANTTDKLIVDGQTLADYIVEIGTSDSWEYVKYNSGRIELSTMNLSVTMPEWTTLSSLYWRTVNIEIPLVTSTIFASFGDTANEYARWTRCNGNWGGTTINVQQFSINNNGNAETARLQGYVIGKWK